MTKDSTITPVPGPDPSYLTTSQILREVSILKEWAETRIDALEKALDKAHDDLVRVPTDVQKQVGALRDVVFEKFQVIEERVAGEHNLKEEKFAKVDQRFDMLETQRVEQKKDTADAVDKALTWAKESVAAQNNSNQLAILKQENYTSKTMDQMSSLMNTREKATDEKIADLKDKVTRIEAMAVGVLSQKTETKSNIGMIIGVIALAASIIFGIIGFIMGTNSNN